jgi:hypothetical protein
MERKSPGKREWLVVGALWLTCAGMELRSVWGRLSHDLPGEVVATRWERAVVRERFTRVTQKGWKDRLSPQAPVMPVNGTGEVGGVEDVRACERRQRGTRQIPNGTKRVCSNGLKNCRDVPDYRSEASYGDECTYETFAWTEVERAQAAGTDVPPHWPDAPAVGELDRLRREEKYTVHLRYEDDGVKEHVIQSWSEQDFLTWKKGQGVTLTVTRAGEVKNTVRR